MANISEISEIKELIDSLRPTISSAELSPEGKEDLADDLDTINEQISSDEPKVSRIRKAYENVKCFVAKASKVAPAATLLIGDWQKLVEKVKSFIESIS